MTTMSMDPQSLGNTPAHGKGKRKTAKTTCTAAISTHAEFNSSRHRTTATLRKTPTDLTYGISASHVTTLSLIISRTTCFS